MDSPFSQRAGRNIWGMPKVSCGCTGLHAMWCFISRHEVCMLVSSISAAASGSEQDLCSGSVSECFGHPRYKQCCRNCTLNSLAMCYLPLCSVPDMHSAFIRWGCCSRSCVPACLLQACSGCELTVITSLAALCPEPHRAHRTLLLYFCCRSCELQLDSLPCACTPSQWKHPDL